MGPEEDVRHVAVELALKHYQGRNKDIESLVKSADKIADFILHGTTPAE